MIDIEKLQPGMEVWITHQNSPLKLIMQRLDKLISANGVQFNVVDGAFSVPADWCFLTEIELIQSQLNYWQDLKFNKVVGCSHDNWRDDPEQKGYYICENCGSRSGARNDTVDSLMLFEPTNMPFEGEVKGFQNEA